MSFWTIVLIILVIALLGGFSGMGGGPFYGTGYYGGGGLGLVSSFLSCSSDGPIVVGRMAGETNPAAGITQRIMARLTGR